MINYIGTPKKELGQNFLKDLKIVEDLINASDPRPDDVYLEIGAGQGIVTKALASRVSKIFAVEFDRDLITQLKQNLRPLPNVEIINAEVLSYLRGQLSQPKAGPPLAEIGNCQFSKIVGSIPYQIASPLIHQLAELIGKTEIELVVLLIQKEVAQKIAARSPQTSYLSTFVQTFFDIQLVQNVSRESFRPIPKVDGTIIKLKVKSQRSMVDPGEWSKFLHQGFKHPRQMLKKVFDEKILLEADIRTNQRAQELSLDDWLKICRLIKQYG